MTYFFIIFYYTEHGTNVVCAKCQDDFIADMGVMDDLNFASSEFKMGFGGITYLAKVSLITPN